MPTLQQPPLTVEQIEKRLEQLRAKKIELIRLTNERDNAVQAISRQYGEKIDKLDKEIQVADLLICGWCLDNRQVFGEKKTYAFRVGTAQFRMGKAKVVYLLGKTEDMVIKALKRLKRPEFIRTKEAVDKEGILKAFAEKKIDSKDLRKVGLIVEKSESISLDLPLATAGKEAD